MGEPSKETRRFFIPHTLIASNGQVNRLTRRQERVIDILNAVRLTQRDNGVAPVSQNAIAEEIGISRTLAIKSIRDAEQAGLLVTVVSRKEMSRAKTGCKAYMLTEEGGALLDQFWARAREARAGIDLRALELGVSSFDQTHIEEASHDWC